MNIFKKVGALTSASALAGLAVFAGVAGVANAAPVTLVIDSQYLAPGGSVNVNIDGCPVGAGLAFMINQETVAEDTIKDGDLPTSLSFDYEELDPGATMEFSVACTPAADSDEAPSTANGSVTVFGATYVEAVPDTFYTGETVSITAGDFLPGAAVTLHVVPKGAERAVHEAPFGTAGADFSARGDVVFPEDLECGDYLVEFSNDKSEDVVTAELKICGAPDEEPSPSTSPSATTSPSAQPSTSASPTRPARPGLPSTGN